MIKLNMVSESEFTVKGHGVHTAYLEITNALRQYPEELELEVNGRGDYDIVHIQTMGLYALRWLWRRKVKKVVSAHLVADSFVGSIRWAKAWKPLATFYLKQFYKRADLVLSCSASVDNELRHLGLKNTNILYNSIDMARYTRREDDRAAAKDKLGYEKSGVLIMGNGQLQPRKRFDLFFEMAKARPDYDFVWVGGIPFGILGAEAEHMSSLVRNAPANLKVTGVIPLEDVRVYYMAADIFVLPAQQENHPMCVLEAAGSSLPIVLRDIPNYEDTFRGGALFAPDDQAFYTCIDRLAQDERFRQETAALSTLIRTRFDSRTQALKLIAFYKQLLPETLTN